MSFDPLVYPYPSARTVSYARHGMVATSQPLAAQAGLTILQKGGNAIDAAVATAACLTVCEPTSNGIGGDAFAMIWTDGHLHGLNSSGPAPRGISRQALRALGHESMPAHGWAPVTVPGAPGAWATLCRRFGRLPLHEVLAPAIEYAEKGYPLSPTLGRYWRLAGERFAKNLKGPEFSSWFETFAPDGRVPDIGEIWRSPYHARALRSIADTEAESFYRGDLAEIIDHFSRKHGGYLRAEDLAAFHPEWVDPIGVNYRGYHVWEIPPNGQGLVALMALNILKGFEFTARDDVETYHRQIEATKLAFVDGLKYITQREHMQVSVEELLSEHYADTRRQLLGDSALLPEPGRPADGGTVYLATGDGEGNMVSYIQSNYMGFGSGVVIPGTGISLQNRGHTFSLEKEHHNCLEPGKKTYHTIIPAFMTRNGEAMGPFGVMGGFMQPQGHVQVVMNTVDFSLNPQAALDAPRYQWEEGTRVNLEHHFPPHLADALARRGHTINWGMPWGGFGRGQIIWRLANGTLCGGTDHRTDGHIAMF